MPASAECDRSSKSKQGESVVSMSSCFVLIGRDFVFEVMVKDFRWQVLLARNSHQSGASSSPLYNIVTRILGKNRYLYVIARISLIGDHG